MKVGNTYTMLIYQTRPPTADTHKPQIKRKKKKRESRLPFSRRPSAGRWRLSCSTGTCSPSARPLVLTRAQSFLRALLNTSAFFKNSLTLPLVLRPLKTSFSKTSLHQHSDSDLYSALLSPNSLRALPSHGASHPSLRQSGNKKKNETAILTNALH